MNKFLKFLGFFMLLAVILVNRVCFQISDILNIFLCIIAALFMCLGILREDVKYRLSK